jgi:uncharacterized repeat protein (TIGR03803 family)
VHLQGSLERDKTVMRKNYYWRLLVLGCWALLALPANAQNYKVLYSFTGSPDGANPYASLVSLGNVLYGTTSWGGSSGNGTVFKVNADGAGYVVLKSFSSLPDGATPTAGLTLSSNVLYGTTSAGGSSGVSGGNPGAGTLFEVNIDGTGYSVFKNFQYTDGPNPAASLTLSSNMLYGTTHDGGSSGRGVVFKINTDGTGYAVLKSFTNSPDGAFPVGSLTLSGSVLYGTTSDGGNLGNGTVFKINTDGTGYAVLKSFTNSPDGFSPAAGLTLLGNVLYGTTGYGGSSGNGTVFKINTDGTGYAVLKSFTNSPDGAIPSGLTLSGNVFYGTTIRGGSSDYGTVFKINMDGTGYAVLKSFTNSPDGAYPHASLMLSGNVLYGMTSDGGSLGNGIVFSLSLGLPPGYNQISNPVLNNGKMSLSFVGLQGTNYALDRSFSLFPANWIPQVTNPADANGNCSFTNTPDPTTNNFWRIRSVP